MAKVLFIGDTHNGANGNNARLLQQNVELYERIRKIIRAHNIDFCIDLGDFFDDREKIDVKTLGVVRNKMLKDLPVPFYFIVGNHNLYYKNSTLVNNLTETIGDLPNVIIVDKFKEVEGIDLIPWITSTNAEYIAELVRTSTNKWCAGHFEFNGFQFDKTRIANEIKEKIPASWFHHYLEVISGHYHIASHKGNITYLGTPVQLTWVDVDVEKKLLILNTETAEHLELVSSDELYHQYTLDENGEGLSGVSKDDIAGKRIKVHYHVDTDKEKINNLQTILKSYAPDQLSFIPYGQKKKTKTQVSIAEGIEKSLLEYVRLIPCKEDERFRQVVEKLLFNYYNKVANKE